MAAILTMGLTVVVGIGGGVFLFAAMAMVIDYALLIPLFGTVQSGGASARIWLFYRHIQWRFLGLFLLSFIPGAFIGTVIWLQLISLTEWQPIIKMILAVYIILFILFSHTIRITPSNAKRSMLASGALAGIGSMTVGAVAPVMAPFFIALKLNKNEFSGTWAVASFIASASKIPLFILIWDRVEISHGGLIFLLFAGTFIGAYLGKMLFDRTSEQFFRRAMYAFLIIAACKLFVWDGAKPLIADRTNVFNFNTASGKTIQVPN
ncbi:MAG: TSUP family transporter [Rhodospirillales bacterium]